MKEKDHKDVKESKENREGKENKDKIFIKSKTQNSPNLSKC